MSVGKRKPLQLFVAVTKAALGVTSADACALLAALDGAGLVVMPLEPTGDLIDASLIAMRRSRRVLPTDREAAQRVKHEIRYRAMAERQREGLGLLGGGRGENTIGAADRAIAATIATP